MKCFRTVTKIKLNVCLVIYKLQRCFLNFFFFLFDLSGLLFALFESSYCFLRICSYCIFAFIRAKSTSLTVAVGFI